MDVLVRECVNVSTFVVVMAGLAVYVVIVCQIGKHGYEFLSNLLGFPNHISVKEVPEPLGVRLSSPDSSSAAFTSPTDSYMIGSQR